MSEENKLSLGEIFQRAHGGDSWANLGPAGQACVERGIQAVFGRLGALERTPPAAEPGYQGPRQHPDTDACDGFHPVGEQCNLPPAQAEQSASDLREAQHAARVRGEIITEILAEFVRAASVGNWSALVSESQMTGWRERAGLADL